MNELLIEIRDEKPGDESAIREVTEQAFEGSEFGYNGEAGLIDELRSQNAATISLVAEVSDQIVGHILFSPATIERKDGLSKGFGLAPMSVLPEFQKQGIGSRLIKDGLEIVSESDCDFVIVLGHPEYYPKFGFAPASASNVVCEFEGIPDEAFMIRWFKQPASVDERVAAKYHPVFSSLG